MQFAALLLDSLRESLDRKIFWALLLITGIVVLAMASIGFDGEEVSLFFGLWTTASEHYNPLSAIGRANLIGAVIYLLMSVFLGWIGVILTIIATAGFFPAMLEGGTVDVLLSKPISRPRLFLYKYATSMVFVFLQATVFIVLTFLVMGLRWGVWAPGYLLSIPLLVLLFSYVYCISVLVAVRTRSAVAAIVISLVAWTLYAMPKVALDTFESFPSLQEHKRAWRFAQVVAWVPPKTSDIPYLAARWAEAGTSIDVFPLDEVAMDDPAGREELARARARERREMEKSPWLSIGSSLLFEAVIVFWAMWLFVRKDF